MMADVTPGMASSHARATWLRRFSQANGGLFDGAQNSEISFRE